MLKEFATLLSIKHITQWDLNFPCYHPVVIIIVQIMDLGHKHVFDVPVGHKAGKRLGTTGEWETLPRAGGCEDS